MAGLDEMDFGADTDAIRRWLAKRATYAEDAEGADGGGKHRVDLPGKADPQRLSVPNSRDAEQHVLDALVVPDPPIATQWPRPYQPPVTDPDGARATADTDPAAEDHRTPPPRTGTTPGHGSPYASTPEHEEVLTSRRSTNAVFKPRVAARHTTTLVFLAIAAMTVAAGYRSYQEPTTVNQGVTVLLALLALVVFGVRASTSVTELAVIHGQLEMIRNGRFEVIDLGSVYTPVVVEGKPGHRGWRVLIERHGQPLLVIDRSTVDPREFTEVLYRVRPDLRARQATPAP